MANQFNAIPLLPKENRSVSKSRLEPQKFLNPGGGTFGIHSRKYSYEMSEQDA